MIHKTSYDRYQYIILSRGRALPACQGMKYPISLWILRDENKLLSTLHHLINFGVAIAKVELINGQCEIGLVYHDSTIFWQRKIIKDLFTISDFRRENGVTFYYTPIVPLVPGNGGTILLENCIFVPINFGMI